DLPRPGARIGESELDRGKTAGLPLPASRQRVIRGADRRVVMKLVIGHPAAVIGMCWFRCREGSVLPGTSSSPCKSLARCVPLGVTHCSGTCRPTLVPKPRLISRNL